MLAIPRVLSRELRPWARLLEDPFFEPHTANSLFRFPQQLQSSFNSFTPSFDVKETKDSYVLDGELPGITDKSSLDLTFVDPHTLVIKGRVERNNESGKPEDTAADATTTNSAPATPAESETSSTNYHAPMVEEEGGEATVSATEGAVTKAASAPTEVQKQQNPENPNKYWIRERYVGEFQRSFSFPHKVDHDAVKASLKDGILSVVVPKKANEPARKINVE